MGSPAKYHKILSNELHSPVGLVTAIDTRPMTWSSGASRLVVTR
jgi:hypothetical protein